MRGEDSTVGGSGDTTRVLDVGHRERDVFQLLNERGDVGELRGIPASISRLIGALPVDANAEVPVSLADSAKRVRKPDKEGGEAGVLAHRGNGRVSDGKRGVGALVGALNSEDGAAESSAAGGEFEIHSLVNGGVEEREPA